ncbi:MAG: enoyl-CoA hydratase [Acidimicrobiia bacterium]
MSDPTIDRDAVVLTVDERIGTITLNRPESRNAINRSLSTRLKECIREADDRDDVDVMILTGADPAFCAGVDLKEFGSGARDATMASDDGGLAGVSVPEPGASSAYFHHPSKPLIAAVNGAAITGGLEIALLCDFIIASDRARFGDTHARVGIMPGGGAMVLLQQAIGVRRAREMSLTGNFLTADEAFQWGLANHVVPHDELLAFTRKIALDIASYDQKPVRQFRETSHYVSLESARRGWEIEMNGSRSWMKSQVTSQGVEERRAAIFERGRGMSS